MTLRMKEIETYRDAHYAGLKEGREEGREIGREEAFIEGIKKFLQD